MKNLIVALAFLFTGCSHIQETLNTSPIAKARIRYKRAVDNGDTAEADKQKAILDQAEQESKMSNLSSLDRKIMGLVGKSPEEVVLEIGAPTEIQQIGQLTVYRYIKDFGYRNTGFVTRQGFAGGRSTREMDIRDLFFQDNKLIRHTLNGS
jgi:hypothetical protein